jgi:hypothetical protein
MGIGEVLRGRAFFHICRCGLDERRDVRGRELSECLGDQGAQLVLVWKPRSRPAERRVLVRCAHNCEPLRVELEAWIWIRLGGGDVDDLG